MLILYDMNHTNVKKLTLTGILIGAFVILSTYLSMNPYNIKITLQNLPMFLGAIMYGPVEGFLIGFIGMFINQLLTYGFSPTIIFWCLPQSIAGFLLGFLIKKLNVKVESGPKFWVLVISMHLLITVLNTIVIYVDSKIMGYYSFVLVFGSFIIRMLTSVVLGIVYSCIIPLMIKIIKPFMQ